MDKIKNKWKTSSVKKKNNKNSREVTSLSPPEQTNNNTRKSISAQGSQELVQIKSNKLKSVGRKKSMRISVHCENFVINPMSEPLSEIGSNDEKFQELLNSYEISDSMKEKLSNLPAEKKQAMFLSQKLYQKESENKGVSPLVDYYVGQAFAFKNSDFPKNKQELDQRILFYNKLKMSLRTESLQFVTKFIEANGLHHLVDYLNLFDTNRIIEEVCKESGRSSIQLSARDSSDGTLEQNSVENEMNYETLCLSVIGCFRSILNTKVGLRSILASKDAVNAIISNLAAIGPKLKSCVIQFLTALTFVPEGYSRVIQCLEDYKAKTQMLSRFHCISRELETYGMESAHDLHLKVDCMLLINSILLYSSNSEESAEQNLLKRIHIRAELLSLGIMNQINRMKTLSGTYLNRQMEFFIKSKESDENELCEIFTKNGDSWSGLQDLLEISAHALCDLDLQTLLYHTHLLSSIDFSYISHTHTCCRGEDATDKDHCIMYRLLYLFKCGSNNLTISSSQKRQSKILVLNPQKNVDSESISKTSGTGSEVQMPLNVDGSPNSNITMYIKTEIPESDAGSFDGLSQISVPVSTTQVPQILTENSASTAPSSPIQNKDITLPLQPIEPESDTSVPPPPPVPGSDAQMPVPPPIPESDVPVPPPPPVPGAVPPPPPPPGIGAPPPLPGGIGVAPPKPQRRLPIPKKQMRAVNLVKIPDAKAESTIWNKFDDLEAFKNYELEEVEQYFCVETKPVKAQTSMKSSNDAKPVKQSFLDPNKSQNIMILLGNIKMKPADVKELLENLDPKKLLSQNVIDQISKFCPTSDDIGMYSSLSPEEVNNLMDSDLLILQLSKIKKLPIRLKYLNLRRTYDDSINDVIENLDVINDSAKIVLNNKNLSTILEVILGICNFMNTGNRGNAKGFKISSLNRLCDTKSTIEPGMTLMNFLVKILEKKVPESLEIITELDVLKQGAKINLSDVLLDGNKIKISLNEISKNQQESEIDTLSQELTRFVESKKELNNSLEEKINTTKENTDKALLLFGEDPATSSTLEFFGCFVSFINSLANAKKDNIARQKRLEMQQKKESGLAKKNPTKANTLRSKESGNGLNFDEILKDMRKGPFQLQKQNVTSNVT